MPELQESELWSTKRCIKDIIREHKDHVQKNVTANRCTEMINSLVKHSFHNLHRFDFDFFQIVDKETYLSKRSFLEMAHMFAVTLKI